MTRMDGMEAGCDDVGYGADWMRACGGFMGTEAYADAESNVGDAVGEADDEEE